MILSSKNNFSYYKIIDFLRVTKKGVSSILIVLVVVVETMQSFTERGNRMQNVKR